LTIKAEGGEGGTARRENARSVRILTRADKFQKTSPIQSREVIVE
jgi:hypothetical protein